MPNPDDVYFISFQTDQSEYQLPLGGSIIPVKFFGNVANNGLTDSIYVTVTLPNDDSQELSPVPNTNVGYFETFISLSKDSQTGTYKAKAKYIEAESDEMAFQVVKNPNA